MTPVYFVEANVKVEFFNLIIPCSLLQGGSLVARSIKIILDDFNQVSSTGSDLKY
jgi:hypothetical protein